MPDPNTCMKRYGEKPGTQGYNDCLAYTGKYKYDHGGKLNRDKKIANPNFNSKLKRKINASDYSAGGKFNKKGVLKYSPGGMLMGPSHENGGISAIVDGTEPIEVEGGEFIINKQTVDAVGETFLHKLNSTQTSYHTGGYDSGDLPQPSNYKRGGRLNENSKRVKKRKLETGGSTNRRSTRRFAGGGRVSGRTANRTVRPITKMRRGGKTGPSFESLQKVEKLLNKSKFNAGGSAASLHSYCRSLGSDATSCKNYPGCTWNPDGPSCH